VLSLALGIGANTTIFQLVDAVRLRMLPIRDPERLVQVRLSNLEGVRGSRSRSYSVTYPIWTQIRDRQQAIPDLFAWGTSGYDLATSGEPHIVQGLLVSGNLFRAVGIRPAAGRLFSDSDDRPGCGTPGAVISTALWQRQFGGRPSAIGTTINLNRHPVEVIGVTPPEFFGMEVGRNFDVAVPICSQAAILGVDLNTSGSTWWIVMMGRLQPGWSLARATAYFQSISPTVFTASLPANYPPVSVKGYLGLKLMAEPAGSGVSYLRETYTQPLWLLLGIAGLVLLIACANLANLMLARASARQREIAVRLAVGASRSRLVGQLMAESLLISAIGATLGLAVAKALSPILVRYLSTESNTIFVNLDSDWRIFAFAGTLAVITSLLFGLAPALRSTRTGIGDVLKATGRGNTEGRERFGFRRALVVLQVALSLVLVVSALLFSTTLKNLLTANTGFRQDGVLVVRVGYGLMHLPRPSALTFRQDLLTQLRAVPGVIAVGDTDTVPLSGSSTSNAVWMDGTPQSQSKDCMRAHVGPGYFNALATPVLSGRAIDERDTANSPKVAVVNEAFAKALLNGENPVGRRLWVERTPFEPSAEYEIVGIVRNTKYAELREDFPPIVFQAQAQDPVAGPTDTYLIRSSLAMEALSPAVRSALTSASPGIRYRFQIFQTSIQDTLVQERLMASVSTAFGILAGLLAAIGLYGVRSYLVARRRNEIGIRIALGASRGQITFMVLRESGLLLGAGLSAGTALSVASTRAVATLLFGLKPTDIGTLLTAALLLAVVALAASYVPARRAARLDASTASREE
jgi:predicted permease